MRKIGIFALLFFIGVNICIADSNNLDTGGWEAIPLNDSSSFDNSCEYRFYTQSGDVIYPTDIRADSLITKTSNGPGVLDVIYSDDKAYYNLVPDGDYLPPKMPHIASVAKIEKRCATTPSGLVALFIGTSCPNGWQQWPISMDIKCGSTKCPSWVFCKKIGNL